MHQRRDQDGAVISARWDKNIVVNLLGGRAASAIIGIFMLALGSSVASAQDFKSLDVAAAVKALDTDQSAKPLGNVQAVTAAVTQPVAASVIAVPTASGAIAQAQPAHIASVSLASAIDHEAAWLYRNGWPLYALVDRYSTSAPLETEANCLATAVYFEARGESLEGQLAVARVVMNRAASGRYPPSYCATVRQPAQFSFVRAGRFPPVNADCQAWKKAEAIARLALANVVPSVGSDVLWYHADYVAPSWGRRLTQVSKIGQHIFYRA